jgi:hypothetical protein
VSVTCVLSPINSPPPSIQSSKRHSTAPHASMRDSTVIQCKKVTERSARSRSLRRRSALRSDAQRLQFRLFGCEIQQNLHSTQHTAQHSREGAQMTRPLIRGEPCAQHSGVPFTSSEPPPMALTRTSLYRRSMRAPGPPRTHAAPPKI